MRDTVKTPEPETKVVTVVVPAYYSSSEIRVAKVTLRREPWDAQPEVAA